MFPNAKPEAAAKAQDQKAEEEKRLLKATMLNVTLFRAARAGNAKEIAEAIYAGADVNASFTGHTDCSPLHTAARNGHTAAIKELLDKGANPHKECDSKVTALQACLGRKFETVLAEWGPTLYRRIEMYVPVDPSEARKMAHPAYKKFVNREESVKLLEAAQSRSRPSPT